MRGITAGPDGNVWVCASDSNRIARISPAGMLTTWDIPSLNAEPYESHPARTAISILPSRG